MFNNGTSDVHVKYIPQQKTWFEAQEICESIGGRLATDKDSNLTCDKVEGDSDYNKGYTFWSGHYTTLTDWISKEGCSDISRITEMPRSLSLSECFEVCRHQNTILNKFAYRPRDQNCACLHSNAYVKLHEVYNCSELLRSNTTYLVYSVIQSNSISSTGNCAFVDCRYRQRREATSCNDLRRPFCGSISNLVNWTVSQKQCKDNIPTNISNDCIQILEHDDKDLKGIWLPIQRVALRTEISDDGIYHEKDVTHCTSYHCQKGKEGTRNIAHTACNDHTDGFFCLFFKGTTTTNVTTTQQTTITVIMEHIVTKNSTDYLKQTSSSNTGLIVGGVVGTVLLILAIVLIVVLKIRCKNATSKKENDNLFTLSNGNSPTYDVNHGSPCSSSDKMFNNKLYDEQRLPSCKIVLDENIRNEKDNREDFKNQNYDYAVSIEIRRTQLSPNQEGFKDCIDVESEYDILNKNPRSLNNTLEHNIYDTTIASRCESDPTYNTATNMSNRTNNDVMYDRL